uniref:Lysosomal dipeptide transporter MFSD1 n=1 Tax=Strigamia maritima TaxID=126957 RepID=T1ITK3_STRMM
MNPCLDARKNGFRFALLFSNWLVFGAYFCYDMPSVLQTQFQQNDTCIYEINSTCCVYCLGMSGNEYNLLYAVCAWTIAIVIIGAGFLLDKLGNRVGAFLFSFLTISGSALFAGGAMMKRTNFLLPMMLIGRILLGAGTGSLLILQNRMTSYWFKNKELALAFGVTLALNRLGSVLNFLVTEHIDESVGLVATLWCGTGICVFSSILAVTASCLDMSGKKQLNQDASEASESKSVKITHIRHFSMQFWLLCFTIMFFYNGLFPFVSDASSNCWIDVHTATENTTQTEAENFQQLITLIFEFHFQSNKFIQDKYAYGKKEAAYISGAVYYVSLILSPLLGGIIDIFGKRGYLAMACALFTLPVFCLLAFTEIHPLVSTVWFGITYSIATASMLASLPLVAVQATLGTALGVASCIQMLGTGISNSIVGAILGKNEAISTDEKLTRWKHVIIYFLANMGACVVTAAFLNLVDMKRHGVLNLSRKQKLKLLLIDGSEGDVHNHYDEVDESSETDSLLSRQRHPINYLFSYLYGWELWCGLQQPKLLFSFGRHGSGNRKTFFFFPINFKANSHNIIFGKTRRIPLIRSRNLEIIGLSYAFRFIVLFFNCLLTFGSYFCFDMPSVLQTQFQQNDTCEYSKNSTDCCPDCLGMSGPDYNLLYAIYAWTNAIVVVGAGFLLDKLGNRVGAFLFSSLTVIGAALFAGGAMMKGTAYLLPLMVIGRLLFGAGNGSLTIVQNRVTSYWFHGKELAMAFGITLAFSRLGSVLNFLVTEHIDEAIGLVWTLWFGTGLCVLGFLSAVIVSYLDISGMRQLNQDAVVASESKRVGRNKKITHICHFSLQFWLLCLTIMFFYNGIFPFVSDASKFVQDKYGYDKTKASYITGGVYDVSMVLSPFLGGIIDIFGKRGYLAFACALLTLPVFGLLAFTYVPPLISILWLGVTYSVAAASMWPSIPLVVNQATLGTALGLTTCVQMLGIGISNLVVGAVLGKNETLSKDETLLRWKYVMIYLLVNAVACLVVSLFLNLTDRRTGGILNLSRHQKLHLLASSVRNRSDSETASRYSGEVAEPSETDPLTSRRGSINRRVECFDVVMLSKNGGTPQPFLNIRVTWKVKPLILQGNYPISATTPKLNTNMLPPFKMGAHWVPNSPVTLKDYYRYQT